MDLNVIKNYKLKLIDDKIYELFYFDQNGYVAATIGEVNGIILPQKASGVLGFCAA